MPDQAPAARPARRLAAVALALVSLAACSSSSGGTPTPPAPSTFTLHYHRALADYTGWTVVPSAGAVETSVSAAAAGDGFGAIYTLTLKSGATALTFTMQKGAETDPAGPSTVDVSGTVREAWSFSGSPNPTTTKPPAIPGATQVAVYYTRSDTAYVGWGLHLWGDQVTGTDWGTPLQPSGTSADLGIGFLVDLKSGLAGNCPAGSICMIVHKGPEKDPGPDMSFKKADLGNIVFVTSGSATITSAPRKPGTVSIEGASAHLVTRDTVAWIANRDPATNAFLNCVDPAAATFELRYSATAAIKATDTDVTGGSSIGLIVRPAGLGTALEAKIPRLKGWCAFDVAPADLAKVPDALKGQVVAVARKADGKAVKASQVQTAFALDDLYAYEGPLGLSFATVAGAPTFRLWAPTAQIVKLHVYDSAKAEVTGSPVTMTAGTTAGSLGLWTANGPSSWYGNYYRFEIVVYHPATGKVETVTVTDPYATSLSTNSLYAQVTDLADPNLAPAGWSTFAKPPLAHLADVVAYEGHVRDFSVFDPTVPAAHRGKFLAFTDTTSDGMKHLAALASAGLTHLHLLPAFDIATIDEDPANRVDLDAQFATLCAKNPSVPTALCGQHAGKTVLEAIQFYAGDSDQQQAIAGYMRSLDSYNWGYDPLHYGVPEGSYASTAEGTARIVEFRQMVQGLAQASVRLVMDVVYNHTNAAGVAEKSVLDKVVPWYYHRLGVTSGYVESSSCCANTATEHRMMERLMVDTVVRWARDYKVDGFRFDLMGLHMKANMLAVQAALTALTPVADGVDGAKIYLYGEGWDMGETAKNACGENANQANMAGTGIGTFNDRIRDGVRGGSPFDNGIDLVQTKATCTAYTVCAGQGFATGLYTDPNESNVADAQSLGILLADTDWIKSGMAGGLKDFVILNSKNTTIKAEGIGYSGARTGYTLAPQESVNYISAHDNQTLWDISQLKLPKTTATLDRVRVQNLALDTILLGQGVPFIHLGDELLRSKSEDKNSYDSGDWFNRVDWTATSSTWKTGLPPAGDNQANWPLIQGFFSVSAAAVGPTHIASASAHVQEMLRVRKSSPLFRLRTGADVKTRVDFPNSGAAQVPGLLVMTITDGTCAGADLDAARDALVVIVNADKISRSYTVTGATGFTLHAIQQASADPIVKTATFTGGTFTVPARTTAVFEQLQTGAQGAGVACNTRVSI
jgi:pullulanase-type alpha-1,6-glucosidase